MKTKIVVWKDGSFKVIDDGITFEFENDSNWLTTILVSQPTNEEINQVAIDESQQCFDSMQLENLFAEAFEKGAQWAINKLNIT